MDALKKAKLVLSESASGFHSIAFQRSKCEYYCDAALTLPPTFEVQVVSTGAPHKRTILIAEGQPLLREYLCRLLEDPGCQLLSASDGNDAISIATNLTQHLDLLVTDSQVGSMTGFQIGDRLLQENPGAKVLMISTISVLESAALRRGFEFLRKPFGRVAFMSRVKELLASVQSDTERSPQPGLVIPFRTMPPTGTQGNRRKGKAPTLSPQRRAG